MRPRKRDSDLPQRLYFRHGRFYHVFRGKWTALSADRAEAILAAEKLNAAIAPGWSNELLTALEKAFYSRRQNARARGLDFTVTSQEILAMAKASKWRCALCAQPRSH